MANTVSFSRDVYPALSKVIFAEQKRVGTVYDKIMNVLPTNRWYEEHNTEVGYGLFSVTGDGESYHQDEMYQGYYTKIQLFKYTKYFRVTEDLMRFGKYVTMGDRARDMGDKARITKETTAALVYNQGGTTNLADGVPLFSTSHPGYPGSGATFANILSTQAALSYTSYQSVITALRTQVDERGTLIQQIPRKLVVHPASELVAREILKSAGRPDTANRADNQLKDMTPGVELIVNPFLTSTTMWFVICDVYYVYAYEHGGLRVRHEHDPFNNDEMVFGSYYLSTGASHYLGLYAGSL